MNFLNKLWDSFSKKTESTSPAGKISVEDLGHTLREGIHVGLAAVIAFMLEKVPSLDLGQYQTFFVPIVTSALTLALKFFRDNTKE